MASTVKALSQGMAAVVLAAAWVLALPLEGASAGGEKVDLELVIATDVSYSVDGNEAKMQRQGVAEAFLSQEVVRAIEAGDLGRIAVTYLDFSEHNSTRVLVPWRIVHDKESAEDFANTLLKIPRTRGVNTSISEGIELATTLIAESGYEATQKTIDVSGDGPNNEGHLVTAAREAALSLGITINGLPIITEANKFDVYYLPDLDKYYRGCVIGGPKAFIQVAYGFEDFARAMRRKLVLEISDAARPKENPLLIRTAASEKGKWQGYVYERGCDIGERMRYGTR
jgi:Protein of unknown function (DUF1194)